MIWSRQWSLQVFQVLVCQGPHETRFFHVKWQINNKNSCKSCIKFYANNMQIPWKFHANHVQIMCKFNIICILFWFQWPFFILVCRCYISRPSLCAVAITTHLAFRPNSESENVINAPPPNSKVVFLWKQPELVFLQIIFLFCTIQTFDIFGWLNHWNIFVSIDLKKSYFVYFVP